jgi:hypothetical protein
MAQVYDEPRVQIRPSRESDAASFNDAVNAVAAEKWYLATVDGFSLELGGSARDHPYFAGLTQPR